ncbi:MAG: sulfatase [Chitinophagaceae bacterium]|nr:sulfatase [Chitinophagaceae bacterium]
MNTNQDYFFILLIISLVISVSGCTYDVSDPQSPERKIIIVIIDGPRYSETWGDSSRQYIPYQSGTLQSRGVLFTGFYNDGITYTLPGHDQIVTGVNESIDNTGLQLPAFPSFFQYWRKQYNTAATDAWIITSKDKLAALADCNDSSFHQQYNPSTDCGIAGPGTGYRDDTTTLIHALEILQQYHPHLVLIQFKEPDASAHLNNWNGYINGIHQTDQYVKNIDAFLQQDSFYKEETDLIITNDHGRHKDGWLNGFISHGDSCEGCRHISLLATGPDFNTNQIIADTFTLRDLNATISYLLSVNNIYSEGKVIETALKK